MDKKEEKKEQSDAAVFTFGRFNPVTTGHKKLVDHVINVARHHSADHYIFASQSHDPKKNPLSYHQKVHFIKKMMPHANVEKTPGIHTAIDAVRHLHKKGYKKVTMIVGGDRVQEFHNLLHRYNGTEYQIPHLEVKSAGHRDPDSEGVHGMSASKMRAHAAAGNFSAFKRGTPSHQYAKELYHAVRKGMKLENIQQQNKAIFLVGAPGSGKDMILSAVLENTNLLELPLEKVFQAITNRQDLPELVGNPSLIVNGTAESGQKVNITKQVLEAMGYATSMVYVHTTNEESRRRNAIRASSGAKTVSESVRQQKYNTAQIYMRTYSKAFDPFYIFDNSTDLRSVGEEARGEILSWLVELGEGISRFLGGKDLNRLFENISSTAADNSVGKINAPASDSPTENDATIIQKQRRANPKKNIMKEYGGTAVANKNSFYGTTDIPESVQNDAQVASSESPQSVKMIQQKSSKKKVGRKAAAPPPDFQDSRLGTVPSGGIGLVSNSYQPKGKTISELRRNINSFRNNPDRE